MKRDPWIESTDHWVVKVGSAVFLREARRLDRPTFAHLVEDIAGLIEAGRRITIVSSGAVALGREHMGWPEGGNNDIPSLQGYAAVGQSRLMQMWADEFAHHGHRVAQILFSRGDLDDRGRFLKARMALEQVHALDVIPIINENDTVATEELRFGDNDRLAAMTCGLVEADLLALLSDVEGVFDVEEDEAGRRRLTERIPAIESDEPRLEQVAGPSTSGVGRGGMISKVEAAQTAANMGVPTVVAPGKRPGVLDAIASAEDVGTLIAPRAEARWSGKKVWLGASARPSGRLVCDQGAVRALTERGASLLPSGIVEVEGDFSEGDVVELVGPTGEVFGRGVAVYGAEETSRIAGCHSEEIEEVLGYRILDTVVHRDGLVIL
ncbi:MAG: glutamate 5-kinase [Persicimonas sp.]